jgi:hypothetical protein
MVDHIGAVKPEDKRTLENFSFDFIVLTTIQWFLAYHSIHYEVISILIN